MTWRWGRSSRSSPWPADIGRFTVSIRVVMPQSCQPAATGFRGVPNNQLQQFMFNETRFRMVEQKNPDRYKMLLRLAQAQVTDRYALYHQLAEPRPKHGFRQTCRHTA